MPFTGGPGPTFEVNLEGNPTEAETEGERIAGYLQKGLERAFANLGPQLAREFAKGFRNGSKSLFDDLQERNLKFVSAAAKQTRDLALDFEALNSRVEATRRTLAKTGADPHLFDVFNREIQKSQSNIREFQAALDRGDATPEMFDALDKAVTHSRSLAQKEVAGIQSTLKTLTVAESKAAEAIRVKAQQEATRRDHEARRAHGNYIAQYQRETAEVLVEQRNAGRLQAQQERATQRTRLEIIKFAFGQIRALERGLSDLFGGVQTLVGRSLGGVASITSRLGGIFKRSNRDMNDGLSGALRAREGALSRSFRSQSTSVTRELSRQSAAIERFDRQASTGVFGALSGRSRVGTALGLGAGIGGGFALFQGLKNGLQVGGDFVQGLAVLQAQLELTDEQMQSVREQSIALGNDISLPGVSALDAAQAIQILAKQFGALGAAALPAAQAAAKGVLQLSRAAGVSSEEAARIIGAAVNVFGVAADQATEVADQITNALTKGAGVSFTDFADSFVQGAGVFKLFIGPAQDATNTLAEFNAGLDVLAKGGLTGSQAGAALKQFFLQANRGTKDSVESLNLILSTAKESGTLFFDAAGNARTFTDVLDILRRGLKGLDDQTRSTTLQNLFGSRATTAANLFINTTAKEFDDLTAAQLKQGSAAGIAAAQNTGLRGALDALGSVIETQQIKTYERFQGVLGKVVLRFADLLNAFFEGRGKLGVLKDALTGAAAALGALLAARAVGEAFQFMALGIRAVLNPLGLFVTAIVLLGAAFNVLRNASPEFRAEVGRIGKLFQQRLEGTLRRVGDLFASLGRFMRNEVVPRFIDFGNAAIRLVIPAIGKIGDALREGKVLIDAFMAGLSGEATGAGGLVGFAERLGGQARALRVAASEFLKATRSGEATPGGTGAEDHQSRLIVLAGKLGVALHDAADQARLFLGAIPALVRPAIDEFNQLRDAIGQIASGSVLAGLKSALASTSPGQIAGALGGAALGTLIGGPIGTAIGAAVGFGFGGKVIDALVPELKRVGEFIKGFFTGKGGGAGAGAGKAAKAFLLGPFQEAVTALGFFIGNLATDPRIVAALEKLVGLALLTGANFVKGVALGINNNLPALGTLIGGQLLDALKAGLHEALDPTKLARLVIGGLGAAVLATALVRSLARPINDAGKKVGDGFLTSFAKSLRAGAVGSTSNPFAAGLFGGVGTLERNAANAARRAGDAVLAEQARFGGRLKLLGQQIAVDFTDGVASVDTRKQFEDLQKRLTPQAIAGASFRASLGALAHDVNTVFSGIGQVIGTRTTEGFKVAAAGLKSFVGNLRDFARNTISDLKATGIGVGQALGGAIVSGVGAALSGQALGTADSTLGKGLGLAGVIASALFASAAVGGGPQGAVVGSIVLGIGAITAAISSNKKAAEEARAQVQAWIDTLKNAPGGERVTATATKLADAVSQLDLSVQEVFKGFNFNQLASGVLRGTTSLDDMFTAIASNAGVTADAIAPVLDDLDRFGGKFSNLRQAAGGDPFLAKHLQALGEQLARRGITLDQFAAAFSAITDSSTAIGAALQSVALQNTFITNPEPVQRAANATMQTADQLERIAGAVRRIPSTVPSGLGLFSNAAGVAQLARAAANIDAVTQAIDSLNQARADRINTQIGSVTSQLDAAKTAADNALQSILDVVSPETSTAQQALGDLVQSIPSILETLPDLLNRVSKGHDIQADFGLQDIVDQFGGGLRDAITKAFTENPTLTSDQLRDMFVKPIETALDQATVQIGTDEAGNPIVRPLNAGERQFFEDQISGLFDGALDGAIKQFQIDRAAVTDLQSQLDDLNMKLPLEVTFNPFQIANELRRLQGLGLFSGVIPTNQEIAAAQAAAVAANTPVATSPATADAAERAVNAGFTVEQINITETQNARATADETTRRLRALAGSGTLIIKPGSIS